MNKQKKEVKKSVLSREQKIKVRNTVDAILNANMERIKRQVLEESVRDLTSAYIMVLNDKFGFGKERLAKVLTEVGTTFGYITTGHLSIQDVKDFCASKGIDWNAIFGEETIIELEPVNESTT